MSCLRRALKADAAVYEVIFTSGFGVFNEFVVAAVHIKSIALRAADFSQDCLSVLKLYSGTLPELVSGFNLRAIDSV